MGKNCFFILMLLLLALACGRSSGDKSIEPSSGVGAFKLKSEKSLPIPSSATLSLKELGGDGALFLNRAVISGSDVEVLVPRDVDCIAILEVDNMPFLRTTISANQIAKARMSKIIDPGELNAVTTYLTGLLEIQANGARAKANKSNGITTLLEENFGQTVKSFGDLSYQRFQNGEISSTENFRKRLNRINLLRVYFLTFRQYNSMDEAGRQAVKSLYNAMFDEQNPVALINAMASPLLPNFPGKGDGNSGILALQQLAREGVFLYENGALTVEELGAFFFAPASFQKLVDKFLFSPTGQIIGNITGMDQVGVDVILTGNKGYSAQVKSALNGTFQFEGLAEDVYTITASKPSLIFDEPAKTVTLAKSERLQGVSFVNIIDRGIRNVEPTATTTVLPEGYYDSVKVTGDANLVPTNIVKGTTIFGVTGTHYGVQIPTDGTATAADLRSSKTAYAGGNMITGTLPNTSASATSSTITAGYISATDLTTVDTDLKAENIKSGVAIFGVTGNVSTSTVNKIIYKDKATAGTLSLKRR